MLGSMEASHSRPSIYHSVENILFLRETEVLVTKLDINSGPGTKRAATDLNKALVRSGRKTGLGNMVGPARFATFYICLGFCLPTFTRNRAFVTKVYICFSPPILQRRCSIPSEIFPLVSDRVLETNKRICTGSPPVAAPNRHEGPKRAAPTKFARQRGFGVKP